MHTRKYQGCSLNERWGLSRILTGGFAKITPFDDIPYTVNSPIRAQCGQAQHGCALKWKAGLKTFPTVYDNPCFVEYRHVIYRWKALELIFKVLKRGSAPLMGVLPYWRIYGMFKKRMINSVTRTPCTQAQERATYYAVLWNLFVIR